MLLPDRRSDAKCGTASAMSPGRGSEIWGSSWREECAAANNLEPDELDEHDRRRNTLKVDMALGEPG